MAWTMKIAVATTPESRPLRSIFEPILQKILEAILGVVLGHLSQRSQKCLGMSLGTVLEHLSESSRIVLGNILGAIPEAVLGRLCRVVPGRRLLARLPERVPRLG